MAKKITQEEHDKYTKEMIDTMLTRAHLTKSNIYDRELREWINDNLDLLSEKELKKYKEKGVILL